MMIYHREKCNFIPVTDPFVRQVWQEFVAPDFNIQIEAVRRRGWHVLVVPESVITETREAFLLDDANEPAAYRAPATRDGMLAFMALMFKGPVVVTGAGADFAVLGSPSGFVLACGPRPLLLRIGGHSTEVPYWRYDNVSSRANHLEPQLEELLSEVLLEYMELG